MESTIPSGRRTLRGLSAASLLFAAAAAVTAAPTSAQCSGGLGRTCVTLRSGPGQGITALVGLPATALGSAAFAAADFAAAAAGTELVEVTTPPASWLAALSDPASKWIGTNSSGSAGSFLLSHPFVLDGCAFGNACIQFDFAADDQLGDPLAGPNPIGVYLNGVPIPGFSGPSGFTTQTTWTTGGIGALLRPGCNRLEVYVRDVLSVRSGAIYSATICYDDECIPEEHINLHTGNGSGVADSAVRVLSVVPGVAFTPATFASACASASFATQFTPPANWCSNVGNSAAGWVTNPGFGTVYAHNFEITACNITSMRIKARGALYAMLGDALGSPNVGVYVNGRPILGSIANGLNGTACLSGEGVVGGCDLVTGTNCICVYVRDVLSPIPPFTALIYDMDLTVRSCALPEQIHFVSDSTVTMRTGLPSSALQATAFSWPVDHTSITPAVVVAPHQAWCPSIGSSSAVWLSSSNTRGPASTLFLQSFNVGTCTGSIGRATLTLQYAVDDHLGDMFAGGSNKQGVYINGLPVSASWTSSGGPGICRVMVRDISPLLVNGTNVFSLYCRDTQAVASGAIWDATIDISPCPRRYTVLGGGCTAATSDLRTAGPFRIGTVSGFEVEYEDPAAVAVFLGLGFGPIPPLDLAPIGAPGCTLDIALVATPVQPRFGPVTSFPMAIPADPALVGIQLFGQGLVLDPTANVLGISVTNAIRVDIE